MNFKQTVKLSHFEGGLYALMVASTESFLFYYAVKQNVTSFQLAILASLPLALGSLSQMFVPKLVADKHLGSSVVWSMFFQFLGVVGILHTVAYEFNFNKLLFFTCIHFTGGLTSGPLWIDWASKIIPKRNFRKYMASRSSYTWYLILIFYIAIALLGQYTNWFKLIYIFIIGAIARILSCSLQAHIIRGEFSKKIKAQAIHKSTQPALESIREMPADLLKLIWIFIIWTSIFRLAVYISSPFFVPYMMNDLKLSMPQFVILSSIPYFGRAIFYNIWGRAGKNYGAFYGIQLSLLLLSTIPIFWILTRNYAFLVLIEILAGISWGGFEFNQVLMIQNFMHPSMKDGSRVLLGIHMALANFFGIVGAVIGSILLNHHMSFYQVFFISAMLRFLTAVILFKICSVKRINDFRFKHYKGYIKNLLPLS